MSRATKRIEPVPERPTGLGAMMRGLEAATDRVWGDFNLADSTGLRRYEKNPLGFVNEQLLQHTWAAQRYTMEALMEHRFVAIAGCRKCSKTHTAAGLVLSMTCSAPTITITVSRTWEQVRRTVWEKVAQFHTGAFRKLPGELGVTSLRIAPEWYAIGMSTNQPGNIQGFHAGIELPKKLDEGDVLDPKALKIIERRKPVGVRLFFIIDEAAEIDARILETLYGSFSGPNVYVLMQGNPTYQPDSTHPFARAMRPGGMFHTIHIGGEDPDPDEHHGAFDRCFHAIPEEVQEGAWRGRMEREWGGRDTPLYRCHVKGLPAAADAVRQFVPWSLLMVQVQREEGWPVSHELEARHMGWDVAASEEGDWNVVSIWASGLMIGEEAWKDSDTTASADRVRALALKWGVGGRPIPSRNVHVDATGVGKGPVDFLRRQGFPVDAVDFGASPRGEWAALSGEMLFADRKAELVWAFRRLLQEGSACVPRRFEEVWRQAQWHTWEEVPRAGGTALRVAESKEDLRKLHGRSPDNFDAAVLAWSRSALRPRFGRVGSLSQVRDLR